MLTSTPKYITLENGTVIRCLSWDLKYASNFRYPLSDSLEQLVTITGIVENPVLPKLPTRYELLIKQGIWLRGNGISQIALEDIDDDYLLNIERFLRGKGENKSPLNWPKSEVKQMLGIIRREVYSRQLAPKKGLKYDTRS